MLGERMLGGDWSPVNNQALLGVLISTAPHQHDLRGEFGLLVSWDSAVATASKSRIVELFAGVRRLYGDDPGADDTRLAPYLGAGLAAVHAELATGGGPTGQDDGVAAYVHSGVQFGGKFAIDVRYSVGTELDLLGSSLNFSGLSIALVFGYPNVLAAVTPPSRH